MTNILGSIFNPGIVFNPDDTRINELLAWMYTTQLLEFNGDWITYTARYKRELFDNIKGFVACNVRGLERIEKELKIRNAFDKPIQFLITHKIEKIEPFFDGYVTELHSPFKDATNVFDLLFNGRKVWVAKDGENKSFHIRTFLQGEQKLPGIIFIESIFTKEKQELLGGIISLDSPETPDNSIKESDDGKGYNAQKDN